MDKITFLKPDISVEKEIELLDPIEDKGEITALRRVSARALVTITDEEIFKAEERILPFLSKCSSKDAFCNGVLWTLNYIKSRINQ